MAAANKIVTDARKIFARTPNLATSTRKCPDERGNFRHLFAPRTRFTIAIYVVVEYGSKLLALFLGDGGSADILVLLLLKKLDLQKIVRFDDELIMGTNMADLPNSFRCI